MNNVSDPEQRKSQTTVSALWAAYGDALGFPTELASPAMVRRRLKSTQAIRTTSWKRLVGGRLGVEATLPEGAYSDDTQLRLATCRAIRGDGTFDVEAFAKIELPVWLSYCLGAGRGSKAAAAALSTRKANWFSNFFQDASSNYINGGGNGAAMRVQPHVWAAVSLNNPFIYLEDVVRNAVSTHGHMRGIAGAVIHACSLADVMSTGDVPSFDRWVSYGEILRSVEDILRRDSELGVFWVPAWEERAGKKISTEIKSVVDEWHASIKAAKEILASSQAPAQLYRDIVEGLGGLTEAERGSGLKSALFSLVAAHLFKGSDADVGLRVVVNLLYSDTDTIATMAGALLGARINQGPPLAEIQDAAYIIMEAGRMFDISQGHPTPNIAYPDLLYWQPPKGPLDAVVEVDGQVALMGLGPIVEIGEPLVSKQAAGQWQWYELNFGQTVLCKRRVKLKSLAKSVMPTDFTVQSQSKEIWVDKDMVKPINPVRDLFSATKDHVEIGDASIDVLTDEVIKSGFDPEVIGTNMLKLIDRVDGIELTIAFSSIVAKAKRARSKRG